MSDHDLQPDLQLARTSDLMAAARSLDAVVDVLHRHARRHIGSDGIAVVLRDDGHCHYVAEDAIEPLWTGSRFPLEMCVSGWAMLHDEAVIIPDIECDPRVPVAPYANKAIRSLVMAPIGAPEPVAALGAYWSAMMVLDAGLAARVEALARLATEAVARVRNGPFEMCA